MSQGKTSGRQWATSFEIPVIDYAKGKKCYKDIFLTPIGIFPLDNAGSAILAGTKKMISTEHGSVCVFPDSEGNRMALHTTN